MATKSEVEMSDAAVDALLSRHETGVLSLARDDEPYAIPISYGYDPEAREAYLRLVSTPDSEKRTFLASEPTARIVVYEEDSERDGEEYASVVGVGTLHRVDLEELTPETIAQYGEARRPLFEVWAEGKADLDIDLYKFIPKRLTGRTVVVDRETDKNE
ncbi:pyridoxamine 5'-phosphate oxidase family protein [Halorubrum sp. CBA1125]|uniref:pyridoxamine 5'-phosphate oxidase family protein n=1 Tax=Halorubrum sp. CBA1125 TaxID=2668072 RepID=UPI0012E7F001|nr:pyridoxamine 5'-phosphate oxidase family protein [Halorubrum sp. CBA1125]MUW14014.1 pyridoxamine 5'-phosphate oxidase family protein [Halorubrum sp. CBA1125]